MKKLLFSLVAIVALSLFSQAQFKLGVKGGISQSSQHTSGNSLFSSDHYRSYQAGLIGDINIAGNLYLQPQVLYSRKGSTLSNSTVAADTKVRMNYIDVPVNLVYKQPLPFGKVFLGAGPSFSYAFGGKMEQGGHSQGLYSGKNWKREDLSLSFTAGLEFDNGFFVSVNSQKGLMDVYKTDGVSVKNRSKSVSVGYLIDWNRFKRKDRG
jgi:hypothetical protein